MKKFLEDLEKELRKNNISETEIAEILEDHQEMIEEAIEEGLSEEELALKFGTPETVAKDLGEIKSKERSGKRDMSEKVWSYQVKEDKFEMEIDLIEEDILVESSDSDELVVELMGRGKPSDYEINFEDNKLTVKRIKTALFRISFSTSRTGDFRISIPKGKEVTFCKLKTISGDVTLQNFNAEDLNVKTTSGDVAVEDMKTLDIKFEAVSGDYSVRNVESEDCFVSLVSGDIDLIGFHVKENVKINTVSGDVKIEDASCVDLDLRTVSGDLDGIECYPDNVALKSVSGDMRIKNTKREHIINVRHQKSVSGDIRIISK